MSELGAKIKSAREALKSLVDQCQHASISPACGERGSAMVCDDCLIVVTGGVLSVQAYG